MKKIILIIFLLLITPIVTYFFSALIFSLIQTGNNQKKGDTPYLVYVVSSSIHTEFLFPLKNDLFDWTSMIPVKDIFKGETNISYVSISWGSKEFFFETKTWDDLKLKVVLRAIFIPSESAVHVDFLKKFPTYQTVYPLKLKRDEYLKLIQFVQGSFAYDSDHRVQMLGDFSYYGTDRFFKGSRKYDSFYTCNIWTNDGLKSINWKRPLWSPFKYGIEYALKEK